MLEWIKKGLSASDGGMDDARIHAGILVLSYIGVAIYGLYKGDIKDIAALGTFIQAFGVGGAALAAGIGSWFGLRKDN